MSDTIFIVAPEGAPWSLTREEMEGRILARWPAAYTAMKHIPVTGADYVAFEVDIDGLRRHGMYVDRTNLTLEDGTPQFWADTIAWFLSLLQSDEQAECMLESVPEPVSLPRDSTRERIVELLTENG